MTDSDHQCSLIMVSEMWEIMERFDEILEVPEARFRGGRVRMQAIKCVVVGDGAVGELLDFGQLQVT